MREIKNSLKKQEFRLLVLVLTIDFATMTNPEDLHELPSVVYFVNNSVVSDSNPPILFRSC